MFGGYDGLSERDMHWGTARTAKMKLRAGHVTSWFVQCFQHIYKMFINKFTRHMHSLKKTACPGKWMVGNTSFLLGWPIFRGCDSFREGRQFLFHFPAGASQHSWSNGGGLGAEGNHRMTGKNQLMTGCRWQLNLHPGKLLGGGFIFL